VTKTNKSLGEQSKQMAALELKLRESESEKEKLMGKIDLMTKEYSELS